MKFWLLALSFLLLAPNLFDFHLVDLPKSNFQIEDFDPKLSQRIQNMSNLESFIDSLVERRSKTKQINTELYADIISYSIRMKFFHGYSHYSLRENWLAALAGRFIWYDLSAIVIADDILKYPMAACSQQSIVLMEFFKRKKIPFRKIAFDHHFAVEGRINGRWIYFDVNLEPEFHGTHRSFEYLKQENRLQELYKDKLPPDQIPYLLDNPSYGKVNVYPAPKARILHYTLSALSYGLWLFPLFLFGVNLWNRKKWALNLSSSPAENSFIFQEQKTRNKNREIGKQAYQTTNDVGPP